MSSVTVNGNTYHDGDEAPGNMGNGGFRQNLIPMLADAIDDISEMRDIATESAASAVGAPGTNATSTTTLTIGLGTKSLTIEAGKLYVPGQHVSIASAVAPSDWMVGTVQSYNNITGALTVNVTNVGTAEAGVYITAAAWVIGVTGPSGTTGVINEMKGANIASAATVNLQTATGNFLHITGTTAITAITLSPGVERQVVFDGELTLVHSASLLLPGGGNIITAAGDRMTVRGDTTGVIVTNFVRAIGESVVGPVTTSTTLSAGDTYVRLQASAFGQMVALADASTLPLGKKVTLDNTDGECPVGIANNSGTLLMSVAPGGIAVATLHDNDSAAGGWTISGSNLEPGLITIHQVMPTSLNATVLLPHVALDENTSIHFAKQAISFVALLVDNTGKTVSTSAAISITSGDTPLAAFKVSTSSVIVFYGDGTTTGKAIVLTVSGASITLGTPATTTLLAANWSGEDSSGAPRIAQLTPTLYVAATNNATDVQAVAIAVNGTSISMGSAGSVATGISAPANSTAIYPLTSTTALVLYRLGSTINNNWAAVVSVSGVTVASGTPVQQASLSAGAPPSMFCLLSSTKGILVVDNNTTTVVAAVLTISGTTVSWGGTLTVESGVTGFNNTTISSYTGSSATRYNPHLYPISATTALLWYMDSSGRSRTVILTESGGTLTAGSIAYNTFSSASAGSSNSGAMGVMSAGDFIAINQIGATGAWRNTLIPHRVNGSSITAGIHHELTELSPMPAATGLATARLSQGDYVVMSPNATALPVYRLNGERLTKRGAISVPNLFNSSSTGWPYPLQVVSSNRLVLVGSVNGATASGTTGAQLCIINLEIAA